MSPWHRGDSYQEDFWDVAPPKPRFLFGYVIGAVTLVGLGFLLSL